MCRVDNKYGLSSHLLEHLLDCLIDAHWAGGLNGGGARHISFNIRHVGILDCAKYCKYSIANVNNSVFATSSYLHHDMINTVSKDGNSVNSFHMRQSSMVRLLAIILEGEQHMAVDVWRPTKSITSKRGRLGSGQRRSESSQFLNHVSGAGGSCAHDHWDPCRVANPNIHFGIMCSQSKI